MKKILQQFRKKQQGMTMIEMIVSLGILIIGITATLGLMASTINFSKQSERVVVVTNLAREGLEMIRIMRDYDKSLLTNSFDNLGTGSFIVDIDENGNLNKEEVSATSIQECDTCKIYLKNNQYTHNSTDAQETIYRRLITISDVVSGEEKKIISQVYWQERGNIHTYELEVRLTNW